MRRIRWLTTDEERAWRAYRRMRTLLDLTVARDLGEDSQLSEADYDVLSTLTEAPEPSWRATDLAARLLWSTSRLAHQVGRMERRGLVARRECIEDKRGAVIELTATGLATLRAAAPHHVESVRRNLIDLLSPEEIAALESIARKVIDALSEPREGNRRA